MNKEFLSVPNSILAGAVIIAFSILVSDGFFDDLNLPKVVKKGGIVEIVEYSDFQCPFCKRFYQETFTELKKNYIDTGKVKFIYKHFPLSIHHNAEKAAEASECARDQNKFLEYHDILFKNSETDGVGLYDADLKKYATELGLDVEEFNTCLDRGEKAEIVAQDFAEGLNRGVSGTPTFFINGQELIGARPYLEFKKVIDKEIDV